ncbi:MAG: metallophosphoesterase family protein [Psychrobacillus sp.]
MKFGIVSDTHSNLHALKAVLEHMDSIGVDKKVHLGDIVGYGPKPSETLMLTLEEFDYIVMGNHDLAVVDEETAWGFNPQARSAIEWTRDKLSKDEIDILSNIKYKQLVGGNILFSHGSTSAGNPFDYLINHSDAKIAFANATVDFNVAFVGHTHVPVIWREKDYTKPSYTQVHTNNTAFSMEIINSKSIVNVGSVGQPRNGDPRASYATYDTESKIVTLYKIPYPVDVTVALMQREGFSRNSWERLLFGR